MGFQNGNKKPRQLSLRGFDVKGLTQRITS